MLQYNYSNKSNKKKNFMVPFYGWSSTASRLEPLWGGSLLFTTQFPEIPHTQIRYIACTIVISISVSMDGATSISRHISLNGSSAGSLLVPNVIES